MRRHIESRDATVSTSLDSSRIVWLGFALDWPRLMRESQSARGDVFDDSQRWRNPNEGLGLGNLVLRLW